MTSKAEKKYPRLHLLAVLVILLVIALPAAFAVQTPPIRISAWYWLNSAPRSDWGGDFVTMRNLGFTDVVLCWGIDSAAFATRVDDSRYAIHMAQKAGIGAYVLLWHPYANSLKRDPQFLQVDSEGHVLHTFDVFNPEWRHTQWKQYLQTVARLYGKEPAMAGYVFDDSFEVGGTGIISYGGYERHAFGYPLPHNPSGPHWREWCEIRAQWWNDWARETTSFIRQVDPNRKHLIYLEDIARQVLNSKLGDTTGVDFARISEYFDAVGGYTFSYWDSSSGSGERVAQQSLRALADLRKALRPNQKVIYTFWVANNGKHGAGPAKYPTADQIRLICEAALASGVRDLDMYGYRIGDSKVPERDLDRVMPGTGKAYPLTGQIPGTFLWDRPEIHDSLAAYLNGLHHRQ